VPVKAPAGFAAILPQLGARLRATFDPMLDQK
jgi:hypothetical protein